MTSLYEDLARARGSYEVDAFIRLLHLHYEDIKEAMVSNDGRADELRGGAKAYRDLIKDIERTAVALTKKTER
jgi:hypothetical protein